MGTGNETSNDDLRLFEVQLAALQPSAGKLDRDRLMFAAGRAAAGCSPAHTTVPKRWSVATAAMALVSVGLAAALVVEIRTGPGDFVASEKENGAVAGRVGVSGETDAGPKPANLAGHARPRSPLERNALRTAPPYRAAHTGSMVYVSLRNRVLMKGLDAWQPVRSAPAAKQTPSEPLPNRQMLNELLRPSPIDL